MQLASLLGLGDTAISRQKLCIHHNKRRGMFQVKRAEKAFHYLSLEIRCEFLLMSHWPLLVIWLHITRIGWEVSSLKCPERKEELDIGEYW